MTLHVDGILQRFREHLADWRGMLRQEVPAARRALRACLGGRGVGTSNGAPNTVRTMPPAPHGPF